jgi:SecD/SecF fusion protein
MERSKKWHSWLIIGVTLLTIYNILPTIIFYSKPLNKKIGAKEALLIEKSISDRVNKLEQDSIDWIRSFNQLIHVKEKSIEIDSAYPDLIWVTFQQTADADRFKALLNKAGQNIPFYPSQLSLGHETSETLKVAIKRNLSVRFDQNFRQHAFRFISKLDQEGQFTEEYKLLIMDRLHQIGLACAGESELAQLAINVASIDLNDSKRDEAFLYLAQQMSDYKKSLAENKTAYKRFFESFMQTSSPLKERLFLSLEEGFNQVKSKLQKQRVDLEEQQSQQPSDAAYKIAALSKNEELLREAILIVKNKSKEITTSIHPLSKESIEAIFAKNGSLLLDRNNLFIKSVRVDLANSNFILELHEDIKSALEESHGFKKELLQSQIYKEISRINQQTNENFSLDNGNYKAQLHQLSSANSFLVLDLQPVYQNAEEKLGRLLTGFEPITTDLSKENYPTISFKTYKELKSYDQVFSFVTYTPCLEDNKISGFRNDASYLILKDFYKIYNKFSDSRSPEGKNFQEDLRQLNNLLTENGYHIIPVKGMTTNEFDDDLVYESSQVCASLIAATREHFDIKGSSRFAALELNDIRQRILAENSIDSTEQEDILKSKELYISSQIDPSKRTYFNAPKPIRSPLWNNFLITVKKYLRGDERKILKWGLDLSGGKTVEIQLKDANGKIVSNELDLKLGVNELFNRVNKMGVSEVSIRIEGSSIILDFPGSQDISASELIQSSSMTFHVVNEKFSNMNRSLSSQTNRFLQDIWNEALVKGRKDADSVHRIALEHLYGKEINVTNPVHKTETAKALYEAGLRLSVDGDRRTADFDTSLSKIAVMKGDDVYSWGGQNHPLMIVFNNYALEGSSLENVRASYDPKNGNFLSFGVKSSKILSNQEETSPQANLGKWTKVFSIGSSEGENYGYDSAANGWRMAVILNGYVVSAPSLNAQITDQAMISGNFTARDTQRLESDLKAGSLSYTPVILSENNVSPELGAQQRDLGITAAFVALVCVVAIMCTYYRFFGVVASVAVIFNLLIMWGALQNIGATITLSGLAAIVLTIGMAVDANVLVLERVREEFAITKNLSTALHQGYNRAFTAILDSNLTTILAALILLNFDAGPVKGFAVTLIIGVVSSMFTAYFVTKTFLLNWVRGKDHYPLNIRHWNIDSKFKFLKWSTPVFILSAALCVFGAMSFAKNQKTIFGMDFTGGYALNVELETSKNIDVKDAIEKALLKANIPMKSFQVKQIADSAKARIILSKSLDEENQVFSGLKIFEDKEHFSYLYETNPRIEFVVDALQKANLQLTFACLESIHYSFKSVSGQMSDSMQKNALIGLSLALLGILIYITVRFEFKYAVSATLGLVYDLLLTLAVLAILHGFGVPIQIDLNAVAALLTIAGYSLNDTIIVFDRVREDHHLNDKMPFDRLIDRSLNTTLSRTVLTSSTTFVVLLCMVLIGGEAIFSFSLLMSLGVVIGTFSSFYVSSKLLHIFDLKERTSFSLIKENDV